MATRLSAPRSKPRREGLHKERRYLALILATIFVLWHCTNSTSWKLTFAGHTASFSRQCQPRTLRRGIFEDMQKSLTDSAVQAASGLSKEENEAMLENCKSGKMSLDDYLVVMKMFGKLGEVGEKVGPLKDMLQQGSNTQNVEDAKERFAEQEQMVKVMTDEERKNPDLFFKQGPAGRNALKRWATAAGKSDQEMLDFLVEYRTMKSMFGKLGQGEDFADVQKQLRKETDELRNNVKTRKVNLFGPTKAADMVLAALGQTGFQNKGRT
ncbi:unnamed protein product [Durusdinium trenchii]|uniref:Signal recognition particle SRP54 subunit M-domain domain-containing protein n=1 Tax=Durusdinium trenchii TaxID=1381693 RepID=A0ABP0S8S3_9DINO